MQELKGIITAIATPFKGGELDLASFERLLKRQIDDGVDGFVICGTTGESPTVTDTEKKLLFETARQLCPSKPLIVGTGTNDTKKTIESTKQAKAWGAEAALVVVPYYNNPPQRGLVRHFKSIADSVDIPILLYNVPSRTNVELSLESIIELSREENIVGIKEATGDLDFAHQIRQNTAEDFLLLSGDDSSFLGLQNLGGDGVISVMSHFLTPQMKKWMAGEEGFEQYQTMLQLLYSEANPIPLKAILEILGWIDSREMRLPMVSLEDADCGRLREEMQKVGLI